MATRDPARLITTAFAGTCLTCEEPYEVGDEVVWYPKVGCWHTDCSPPHNLATYIKDAMS